MIKRNPTLVSLHGTNETIAYIENYLGMEITENDLYDPELMGIWGKIIKVAGKVIKGVTKVTGAMFTGRHKRKERERVAVARESIIRQRRKRKIAYQENVELAKAKAAQFMQVQPKKMGMLTLGLPLAALGAYWFMSQR